MSVNHQKNNWNHGGNNIIPDVATAGTYDFKGQTDVYISSAVGTKKLPDSPIGTTATITATGALTLTSVGGSTVVVLASGQTADCVATSTTAWKAHVYGTESAANVTILDAGGYTTASNVETQLQELALNDRVINVNLQGAILAAGTPMAAWADNASPNPGITLANSKATGIRWNNNATQNAPVWFNVPMPYRGFDATAYSFTATVVASKVGATVGDATTFTLAGHFQEVAALHDAGANIFDGNGGVTTAMTGNATSKTVQLVTVASDPQAGSPTNFKQLSLSITPTSGTLGTDDVIVHRIFLTY